MFSFAVISQFAKNIVKCFLCGLYSAKTDVIGRLRKMRVNSQAALQVFNELLLFHVFPMPENNRIFSSVNRNRNRILFGFGGNLCVMGTQIL